ncbi:MAG: ATP-grasp domain-containing protein [bacterium]|nr:ATP-grasp domain-containing protein [bacterium]
MTRIKVAVLFGGISAEHEVSVITGLQVIEKIDKEKFDVCAIKLSQEGTFYYYPGLSSRKDYLTVKPRIVNFGKDNKGAYFQTPSVLKKKNHFDAAYLAFHGGNGESGQIQGFLEILNVAYTSPDVESSSISMNKVLTKEVLESHDIKTIPWIRVFAGDVKNNINGLVNEITETISLPLIIKPAHLGSSIAINVAKTKVELKKFLLEASYVDSEILIEKFMESFSEYNLSVRRVNGKFEVSEVEKPLSKDEILSFADKYQRGEKKTGGMASLARELPAKIPKKLKGELQNTAIRVFKTIRAKGLVRIDLVVIKGKVYVIEVNPIPGSMSYYLWEASGVSFKEQITGLINQAIKDREYKNSKKLEYKSDIVDRFVSTGDLR